MAEFLNQETPPKLDGFAAMGKPIPGYRKDLAYQTCRKDFDMDFDKSMGTVQGMANALERDQPYEALGAGMRYGLDLTGSYRLMAVLLVAKEETNDG